MLMVSCMVCVCYLLAVLQELRVKDVELKRLSDMINIEKKERQVTRVRFVSCIHAHRVCMHYSLYLLHFTDTASSFVEFGVWGCRAFQIARRDRRPPHSRQVINIVQH
jgi:hypothetical protein